MDKSFLSLIDLQVNLFVQSMNACDNNIHSVSKMVVSKEALCCCFVLQSAH